MVTVHGEFIMQTWPFLSLLGMLATALVGSTPAMAQTSPAYYVGAGARFGFNDNVSFVLDSKAKIAGFGDFSLSARPSVFLGSNAELRLPISVEAPVHEGIYPYGGAGVAYNADGDSRFDPMLTGGVDMHMGGSLYLDVGLNVIFKPGNTDAEFATTLNYQF
jgi:hypothetical protein